MKNFIVKMLKMNKVDEVPAGGAPNPQTPPPPPAPGEKQYDELGYEIVPAKEVSGDQKPPGNKPPEGAPEKPEKVANPATGYGDEEPVVEEPAAPAPPAAPAQPPTELEKKLEGLNDGFKEQVKKHISELGLEGEKLDKFIEIKKNEQKSAIDWNKNQETEAKRQDQLRRQSWHKELKTDPVFGGDKFAANVSRSEKILDEYGAELKKELTEAGQVLRPSVMRMLARLADQLHPDRQLVQGDPPAGENDKTDDKKPLNPLDFYQ